MTSAVSQFAALPQFFSHGWAGFAIIGAMTLISTIAVVSSRL